MPEPKYADYRDGYAQAKADALDLCYVEKRFGSTDPLIDRFYTAIEALQVPQPLAKVRRWMLTEGRVYTEVHRATMQTQAECDIAEVIILKDDQGSLWAWPEPEFARLFTEVLDD